jgi:mRNA-degrading endonuclease RelE of RelBE toxin-antitoxin system
MRFSIIETPDYLADAKEIGLTDDDRKTIVDVLSFDPQAGVIIPGTGGARKIRFPGRGKGKSGGYRVITYYGGDDIPLFLLNVFAKGDKVDLSTAERRQLRIALASLADDYRKGVGRYVEGGRTHPPQRRARPGIRSR